MDAALGRAGFRARGKEFLKMATTPAATPETAASGAPAPAQDVFKAKQSLVLRNCSKSNSREIEFPTDKWGFTSKLKKEGTLAISKLIGTEDKYELLVLTLYGLLAHAKAKHEDRQKRDTTYDRGTVKLPNQ
jgi:hypothetical protein